MNKKIDHKASLITLFNWYRITRINEFEAQCDAENAWQQIQSAIHARRRMRLYRRCASVAAALLVLVGTGLWYLYGEAGWTNADKGFTQQGGQTAMLVATDGSEYRLSSADDKVVNDGGVAVAQNRGKELVYNAQSDASKMAGKHSLNVPRGGEYRLVLSDKTHIHVNAESHLTYPVTFNQAKREVYLQGEAYFDVEKDDRKPFIVHTELGNIEVLGTRFNVTAYGDDCVLVTLEEGSVKIVRGGKEYILSPGEQAIIERREIAVKPVQVKNHTSWASGIYEYTDTPLETIVQQLSRWYDVDIVFAKPYLRKRRFAGVIFRDQPLQQAVNILSKVSDVRFVSKGKIIEITDKDE
ncbi:FecR family protein [Bacteroides reticulotermitis]|uniref:FecR family protein n=1 Tax=Bacteroides reticulotermitis TaxID=1133319 RepID=UPI003A876526